MNLYVHPVDSSYSLGVRISLPLAGLRKPLGPSPRTRGRLVNRKAKLILRRAYGRRNVDMTKVALYHGLGKLPEPSGLFRYN